MENFRIRDRENMVMISTRMHNIMTVAWIFFMGFWDDLCILFQTVYFIIRSANSP